MKKLTFLAVLFAVGSLMAQGGPDQSSRANKRHSKHPKAEVTVQGCVSRSNGDYILMQTDPGSSYELAEGSHKIKLGPHFGEQVEVAGWESPSLSTSSDALNRFGSPSAVTITVTSIRMIEKECTEAWFTNTARVSTAKLYIVSTPDGADIELDGNFVGNSPSDFEVGEGDHTISVKKTGFKTWERKLKVSSGSNVHVKAELEKAE